jgi:hypothetical protein
MGPDSDGRETVKQHNTKRYFLWWADGGSGYWCWGEDGHDHGEIPTPSPSFEPSRALSGTPLGRDTEGWLRRLYVRRIALIIDQLAETKL